MIGGMLVNKSANNMNKNEITLPIEICDGRFTPEEIGAIHILMAAPHSKTDHWNDDLEFNTIVKKLMDKKIVVFENDSVIIDIENKPNENMNMEKILNEFFQKYDVSEEDKSELKDIFENMLHDFYWKGYDDRRIDLETDETSFTGYGKSEDFS